MTILVCDDDEGRGKDILSSISDGAQTDPVPLFGEQLAQELKSFYERVEKRLKDPASPAVPELQFDRADILVLDHHLAGVVEGVRLTAESIIGHLRAFTSAPYIVSLNKNDHVDFDLEFLVGDHETRADVALNTKHLKNPALWDRKRNAKDGFIPWYWPQLNETPDLRRAQIEFVLKHLNDSVLDTLGFDDSDISFLSLHAVGALSSRAQSGPHRKDGIPARDITFRRVFTDNHRSLLSEEERKDLSSAEGAGDIIARDVAARMDLWFRRNVVGPQEPFVDVPHLLMRFPFFLGSRANNVKEWNKSVSSDRAPYGLEPKLYEEHLADAEYDHELRKIWVPNPCFRWAKLKADPKLNEYFFSVKEGDWADVVFCEDRSEFVERAPADGNSPVEFPAEFEGSWSRRYVSQIQDYQYSPGSRLAVL